MAIFHKELCITFCINIEKTARVYDRHGYTFRDEKLAHTTINCFYMADYFLSTFMLNIREMANWLQLRAFAGTQTRPCYFHPLGELTHLPCHNNWVCTYDWGLIVHTCRSLVKLTVTCIEWERCEELDALEVVWTPLVSVPDPNQPRYQYLGYVYVNYKLNDWPPM